MMARESIKQRIARGRHEHGNKFDPTALLEASQLHSYYTSGQRIEVDMYGDGEVILRGRVGSTTGWKPTFLLLLTQRSLGSIYLLDSRTRVLRSLP